MKLRKIISLTLVFAMMLTMFASLTVFAEDTVKVSYVVYSGDDVVSGNLVAGNTYEVAVVISEISSGKFYAGEVTTTYDPEVIQVVDADGVAVPLDADDPSVVMINTLPTDTFDISTTQLGEGNVMSVCSVILSKAVTLAGGVEMEESFELYRIRFKAVKDGATKISTITDAVDYFSTASATATAEVVAPSIRVGDIAYVSAAVADDFNFDLTCKVDDETVDSVKEELASKVNVTFTDEEGETLPKECDITWSSDDFAADTVGEYTFNGNVAIPEDISYTGAAVTVTATVTVDELVVESVAAVEDVICRTTDESPVLPEKVTVNLDNEKTAELDVAWTQPDDFDIATEGTYVYTGTLTGTAKIIVPDGITASVNVVVVEVPEGKTDVTFETTEYVANDIKSDADYTLEDAVEDAAFAGKYTDGTAVDLSTIVWNEEEKAAYDNTKPGKYTITGKWSDAYNNKATFSIEINIVAAGATGIKLYNSVNAKNPITSITLDTLSAKTIYAVLEPAGVEDTITWTIDKTSYATVSAASATSATIKTKSIPGVAHLTARTSSGVSATLKITINASSSDNNGSFYKGSNGTSNLLANAANKEVQNQVAQSSVFKDIVGYEWAATQIETLRLLGVVTGKTNTTFAPADSVTRAEFLAMLVRLLGLQASGTPKSFTDVPADAWYYETVRIASSLGVAHGYENGAFDPNAVISRQDMAVFAERARSVAGINPVIGVGRSFKDQHDIPDYAKAAVNYMTSISVINGFEDETFRPLETANRAQAAVVIYNLYALKN